MFRIWPIIIQRKWGLCLIKHYSAAEIEGVLEE